MIAQHALNWQQQQADAITDLHELLELLQLTLADLPRALQACAEFPLRVPRSFVARMERGNPEDPLLRQVLAVGEEMEQTPGFSHDPLAEAQHTPVPGILHKYHGRVLFIVTGACAVNCRYCFRRHFPYSDYMPTRERFAEALAWLAQQEDVNEVILSGGDPLTLTDRRLKELVAALAEIPHLKRLRIHSRSPVMIPERINSELIELLGDARWQSVLVLHANHANELTAKLTQGVDVLRRRGVTVLNQAVLLAGVNDTVAAQEALANRLFDNGILPYYLHQLDKVQGAAHFMVPDKQALQLMDELRTRLPGFLLPQLVRENAGDKSKTPVVAQIRIV